MSWNRMLPQVLKRLGWTLEPHSLLLLLSFCDQTLIYQVALEPRSPFCVSRLLPPGCFYSVHPSQKLKTHLLPEISLAALAPEKFLPPQILVMLII